MDYDKYIAEYTAKNDEIKARNDELHRTMLETEHIELLESSAYKAQALTIDYNVNIRVLDILEKRKAEATAEVASQN